MATRSSQQERSHEDYRIGWVCALPCEMAAAICMLDMQHPQLPQPETDHNNYTFGTIGDHNVVIACLPSGVMGITSAARVAARMRSTFRRLQFGLMVGIGGGAPSEKHDIRLGDVVVSRPEGAFGGVLQYDYGKTVQGGSFVQTGSLNRPPDILLNAMAQVQTRYQLDGSRIPDIIRASLTRYPRREAVSRYPGAHLDKLFHWMYDHPKAQAQSDTSSSFDWTASLSSIATSCENCDSRYLIHRRAIEPPLPNVHYGLVASGNQVMRNGRTREQIRREKGILCFEMEAAGMVDEFPFVIIRGICDYADSHKNKKWQDYAAITAAAYGSELLSFVPKSMTYVDEGFKSFSYSSQRTIYGSGMYEHRDDQDDAILHSLAFGGMFSRRNNIERRHPQTCTWILNHKRFFNWLNQRHGLLWIKGIPGAGKSTLMAFLHDYFHHHMHDAMLRLDFFLSGRGTELQKQFLGLLRSMTYQIFKEDESVRPRVRRLFLEKISEANGNHKNLVWQQRELESLFCEVIELSAQSRDVLVFVDALDEAGSRAARDIALYFHRLNQCVTSQAGSAKFCISSRHYPMVMTIPGTEIVVEDHNKPDIEKFISEHLYLGHLVGSDANDLLMWRQLQLDLVMKASGSFQWARLIVPLVEKQIADGKAAVEIYNTLQSVPEALHEAYSHVLQHVISLEDRPKSLCLFQWVCLAQRPLGVNELDCAMTLGKRPIFSKDRMKRFVRALSGGLVEIIDSKDQPKAEPVHQSVIDFLMAGGLAVLSTVDYNATAVRELNMVERSHAMIFRTCLKYLRLDGIVTILQEARKLRDIEQQLRTIEEELSSIGNRISDFDVCASDYVPGNPFTTELQFQPYLLRSDSDGLRKTSTERLQDRFYLKVALWNQVVTSADDVFARWPQLPRFRVSRIPEVKRIIQAPKVLQLDGLQKSQPSTTTHSPQTPKRLSTVDAPTERRTVSATLIDYEAPFLHYTLTHLLTHAEKLPAEYFVEDTDGIKNFETILDTWRTGQKTLGNFTGDHHHPNSGTGLLHIAAAGNVIPLARYCLEQGTHTDVNDADAGGNTALHLATLGGHVEMVELLLKARSDILIRNNENHTPLATAFRFSSIPAAGCIIRHCPRDAKHMHELERMLGAATLMESELLVRLLINTGVNVNAKGVNALYKAATYGHERLVRLLLDAGADINARSVSCGGPLSVACSHGHYKIVEMLLERRALISDSELQSGLSRAKFAGHNHIIALFNQIGID